MNSDTLPPLFSSGIAKPGSLTFAPAIAGTVGAASHSAFIFSSASIARGSESCSLPKSSALRSLAGSQSLGTSASHLMSR